MQELSRSHLEVLVGAAVLMFVLFSKLSELRARRGAVRVSAQVAKVFGHQHATSYFVRYTWEGVERTAEYRGPPLRQRFQAGDTIEILIDPERTPDVAIPTEHDNAPGAGMGGGTCSLAGERLWSWWDVLYAGAAIVLIVRGCA